MLLNFFQFTKQLGNWNFLKFPYWIFWEIWEIFFQARYMWQANFDCVHKKQVKIRNKQHFTISCIYFILLYFVFCHLICISFKFLTTSQNVQFHIHGSHMEIGLSKVIKFYTKTIKRSHFHAKWLNVFRMLWQSFWFLEIFKKWFFSLFSTSLQNFVLIITCNMLTQKYYFYE